MSRPLLYLISAEHYDFARHEARERLLSPSQWRFIPWEPRFDRRARLAGLAGYGEDRLIGWFSDEERARLMREI